MKLLLDQGLPRSAASLLRKVGFDAIHTGEIGLATAEDIVILERARSEDRIVVTLDSDFHMLLAWSGASTPSVIRIRIEGLRPQSTADMLGALLPEWENELKRGAMLTVQPRRIRMHKLPILP